jgi:O-methyltransferase
MSADLDRIIRDNDWLTRELRDVKARLSAIESSRWWRLNPRAVLRRARSDQTEDSPLVAAHSFPGDFEHADIEICRRVAPYTMTTPPRVYALMRGVEYVVARGLAGAFVECGVWRGGSMMAAALTLLRLGNTDRDLYLFDTFAGMTPPTAEDVKHSGESAADLLAGASRDSHLWAVASLEDVREGVLGVGYPEERIHFVEGPVEETLPANAPDEIALLRLDTDWYESTKHELVHLYPRLVTGGVLILDDYGYWQGTRRATDEYVAEHSVPLLLNRIDAGARMALKLDHQR